MSKVVLAVWKLDLNKTETLLVVYGSSLVNNAHCVVQKGVILLYLLFLNLATMLY